MVSIKEREVYWNDKVSGLQMMYPTPSPKSIEMGGMPTEEELREYNMCKTEDELASFVIRDCKKYGAKLIRREKK